MSKRMHSSLMPWLHCLVCTLLLLFGSSPHRRLTAAEQPSRLPDISLKPDVPVRHRLAPVSTDPLNNTQLFRLLDLKPDSYYEVRVSFLGTVSSASAPSMA